MNIDEMLTVNDIADRLKVNRETVRRWLRTGALVGQMIGRDWFVTPEELERFRAERRQKGKEAG